MEEKTATRIPTNQLASIKESRPASRAGGGEAELYSFVSHLFRLFRPCTVYRNKFLSNYKDIEYHSPSLNTSRTFLVENIIFRNVQSGVGSPERSFHCKV